MRGSPIAPYFTPMDCKNYRGISNAGDAGFRHDIKTGKSFFAFFIEPI